MRIAFDIKALGFASIAVSLLFFSTLSARASDVPPPPSPAALAAAAPSTETPKGATTPTVAPIKAPTPTSEGITAAENRIPDSVKDVLKHLDKPTGDVSLEDLNSARQAVAKIDILIELEKRLAELDKVRHEREGNSFGSMIPASALGAPAEESTPVHRSGRGGMEVSQISGDDGHYSAIIKIGEESRTVHVGDHLADGSSVLEIAPTEVVVERDGAHRTLHVKNVDTVFGNSF